MESYADTYYIERIQAGDTASFAYLLDKYSRPIHSLIVRIVGSREDAEELAQDTFVKAFRSLSSFKGGSSFATWLYRIAYNTAISHTRKKRYEFLAIEDSALENVSGEDANDLLGQEATAAKQLVRLEKALTQLPPDERALVLLFYHKEKTIEEIVAITGLTASNVKTKLFRTRKKLYLLIQRMEEKENG